MPVSCKKLIPNCSEIVCRIDTTVLASVEHTDERTFQEILDMVDKLESISDMKDRIKINPSDGGELSDFIEWLEFDDTRKHYKQYIDDRNFLNVKRDVKK